MYRWWLVCDVSEQNDRWVRGPSGCEQHSEVGVGGNDRGVHLARPIKDLFIGCCQQVVVSNVARIEARVAKCLAYLG